MKFDIFNNFLPFFFSIAYNLCIHVHVQVWSDELAREADNWISKCDFKHEQAGRGENIAMNTAMDVNGDIVQAMQDWYDEIKDFNYLGKACFPKSCHYTQVRLFI